MRLLLILLACASTCAATAGAGTVETPHVTVNYEGIDETYANAIATTLATAREIYLREWGFDMPDTIVCNIACGEGKRQQLFTDGVDHVTLTMPSPDRLHKPTESGVWNLYGLCHELGHIAMYRTLKDHDFLTTAGAEGWAHYAGSVVTDRVWEKKGRALWPDEYDYRADGTQRLKKQTTSARADDVVKGAAAWLDLEQIIGKKEFASLFAQWQKDKIDPINPMKQLTATLVTLYPTRRTALESWAKRNTRLVRAITPSDFKPATIDPKKLTGKPTTVGEDDNTSDGKRSFSGGGQARLFQTPDENEWYIRSVSIYGSRYGPETTTANFDLVLCDDRIKAISIWKQRYDLFDRGNDKWVQIEIPPTKVPRDFAIAVAFQATVTNGVYVHFDSSTTGQSRATLPGLEGDPFDQGNWMIRVELDRVSK